jgi:sugar phosphate isomerase/epimerase
MMINTCASLGFAGFNLETAAREISAMGFHRIELTHLGAYCTHLPFRAISSQRIGEILEEYKLIPVAMNISTSRMRNGKIERVKLSDPTKTDELMEYAGWYTRLSGDLGISCVSLPIGPRILENDRWREEVDKVVPVFRNIVDLADAYGVEINLEVPHLFQLTDSIERVKRIFTLIDHPNLGATVDSSHWGILKYSIDDFFAWLGSKLRHIHLRDSAGEDTMDFKQNLELTPGEGTVDFRHFKELLTKFEYKNPISLEFEYRHNNIDAIRKEYRKGIKTLTTAGWEFPPAVLEWSKQC